MKTASDFPNSEMKKLTYDPVKRAEETTRIVCRGEQRRYYRFRPARFYGGIATADCFCCCLRCVFCWSWREVVRPESHGRFYSPYDVATKLTGIARKKRFRQVRISGNEPTIARENLIKALENLHRFGVDTHPAVMIIFSLPENFQGLRKRLKAIDRCYEDMEIEELVLWGDVEERLRKARIGYRKAHHPEAIPPEQV